MLETRDRKTEERYRNRKHHGHPTYYCPRVKVLLKTETGYVYRAYRVSYDWAPQLDQPMEKAVPRTDVCTFRVPGSEYKEEQRITKVKDAKGFSSMPPLCVVDTKDGYLTFFRHTLT